MWDWFKWPLPRFLSISWTSSSKWGNRAKSGEGRSGRGWWREGASVAIKGRVGSISSVGATANVNLIFKLARAEVSTADLASDRYSCPGSMTDIIRSWNRDNLLLISVYSLKHRSIHKNGTHGNRACSHWRFSTALLETTLDEDTIQLLPGLQHKPGQL